MSIATTTELICFLVLSAVVVLGALGVVLLSNIVYSAFLLGGVFMAVAGMYLLLNASFVARSDPGLRRCDQRADSVRDHAREQAGGPEAIAGRVCDALSRRVCSVFWHCWWWWSPPGTPGRRRR